VISVALVADSGSALEAMTASVSTLERVHIVRHCHGHAPVGPALRRFAPDLVLVDEMGWPRLALRRIAEVRAMFPAARIVVRAGQPDASWLGEALHCGASAVVPATAGAETLARVLEEVVCERELQRHTDPTALAA
jgi:DNA-binding NarL/FixJ family response regulator